MTHLARGGRIFLYESVEFTSLLLDFREFGWEYLFDLILESSRTDESNLWEYQETLLAIKLYGIKPCSFFRFRRCRYNDTRISGNLFQNENGSGELRSLSVDFLSDIHANAAPPYFSLFYRFFRDFLSVLTCFVWFLLIQELLLSIPFFKVF